MIVKQPILTFIHQAPTNSITASISTNKIQRPAGSLTFPEMSVGWKFSPLAVVDAAEVSSLESSDVSVLVAVLAASVAVAVSVDALSEEVASVERLSSVLSSVVLSSVLSSVLSVVSSVLSSVPSVVPSVLSVALLELSTEQEQLSTSAVIPNGQVPSAKKFKCQLQE